MNLIFKFLLSSAAVSLAACVSTAPISPSISEMNNVETVKKENGYTYVNKVSFAFEGVSVKGDALLVCVLQNVKNRSVTLQDSSSNQFVPYVGFIAKNSAREVGGGQSLKYVSDDKKQVLADGATTYKAGLSMFPLDHSLRFSLSAKSEKSTLSIVYTDIEQAQKDTGYSTNDGYSQLGAWDSINPKGAIDELKKIAENINGCLK